MAQSFVACCKIVSIFYFHINKCYLSFSFKKKPLIGVFLRRFCLNQSHKAPATSLFVDFQNVHRVENIFSVLLSTHIIFFVLKHLFFSACVQRDVRIVLSELYWFRHNIKLLGQPNGSLVIIGPII